MVVTPTKLIMLQARIVPGRSRVRRKPSRAASLAEKPFILVPKLDCLRKKRVGYPFSSNVRGRVALCKALLAKSE